MTVKEITDTPNGLARKLAEVMGEVGKIAKAGFNEKQHYAFVKESDVSDAIRPLLAERHIMLWSNTVSRQMAPLFTTASGLQMWLTSVEVQYQFIDGDTGEITPIQSYYGDGADTGDKGLPKAQSMSLKYFLLKTFLLSTGVDDAESDEKVDRATASAGAKAGPMRVTKGTVAGAGRGGKSTLATTAQVSEIAKQARDLGLDGESVIPVIAKLLGSEPAEGQDTREWLSALTSQQAADIITAMAGMATFSDVVVDDYPVEAVEEASEETPQEPIPVV